MNGFYRKSVAKTDLRLKHWSDTMKTVKSGAAPLVNPFPSDAQQCRGELTEVTVDRKPFVTAAIECDDAETFRDMVSRLALTRWPNRNYGMWLRSRMQECSA